MLKQTDFMKSTLPDIRLSCLRALWGNVPASLRAFSAEITENTIYLRSIYDEYCTSQDKELLSIAGAEVVADYPDHTLHEESIHSIDGEPMEHLAHLIFLRHEL